MTKSCKTCLIEVSFNVICNVPNENLTPIKRLEAYVHVHVHVHALSRRGRWAKDSFIRLDSYETLHYNENIAPTDLLYAYKYHDMHS